MSRSSLPSGLKLAAINCRHDVNEPWVHSYCQERISREVTTASVLVRLCEGGRQVGESGDLEVTSIQGQGMKDSTPNIIVEDSTHS